ncbi:MAG: hypothetical protein IJ087_00545 [Eggerthellaceae bacterium]|nr:hypothetical protein [Eggerthellaceae bacterium]
MSIPCRVADYDDVISTFSVEGRETLTPDFVDYVKTTAGVTPEEYPIVLEVIGDGLSEKEKEVIERIVEDDFAYELGMVEKEERRHTQVFVFMLAILLLVGGFLMLVDGLSEIPRELVFIVLWFAGDTLCDYVLLTGRDLRQERRLAGRLASIKVMFSESYEDGGYTQGDVERLYSQIEKDVRETVRKK